MLLVPMLLMGVSLVFLSCQKEDGPPVDTPEVTDYEPGEIPGLGNADGELTGTPYVLPDGVELTEQLRGGGEWTDYFAPAMNYAAAPRRTALRGKTLPQKAQTQIADETMIWRGSGYGYVDIMVSLTNTNSTATNVEFPAGLILRNEAGDCQNGVLLKKVVLQIPANEAVRICLSFYCGNLSRGSAYSDDFYSWGVVTDAAPILDLCERVKDKKINIEDYDSTSSVDYNFYYDVVNELQSIVWRITDGSGLTENNIEYINSLPNEDDPTPTTDTGDDTGEDTGDDTGTGTGDDTGTDDGTGTGDDPGEWRDEGNQLIYEIDEGVYTARWILTFDSNNICIESVCEMIFADATMAQLIFDQLSAEMPTATLSGTTITIDYTEYHAGLTKEEVLAAIGL